MELIAKYFPTLTSSQTTKLEMLSDLYKDWNSKINVISRKDMDSFYCNHVLHSLSIGLVHPFTEGQSVLDIGTGGGFPGIPLAILFPNNHFTLVDSIRKKTKVVTEVSNALELTNITVVNDRFENIKDKHDIVVSRAVAPALKLVNFTKEALKNKGTHIFLKGGDLTNEKIELLSKYKSKNWKEADLNATFSEDFFATKKIILVD